MTRGGLFLLAAILGSGAVLCLIIGVSMLSSLKSYVADRYPLYDTTSDSDRYECSGSTKAVADELAGAAKPEARASDRGMEYLRYDDDVVTVGPDGRRPCTIHIEDIDAGYSGGSYVFLGPGFTPGSPAGGSGGSSGGPGGSK
ncbi:MULTISPECIES: DUF4247 domain-containing protein [unclassified Mycolicibacterium]|uniref:DUF4247 domain-containing protein n=1 Tax=unclassified Mycolicibacterium TaxID=2636767 RepID=UPI001F4BDB8B|nr:DUF4247 domain-containing protein [Mycolicibacterium sp. YH-1]UNB56195.1 DUF4247 domain-containing protein [Mycolicibacterium sp. YH-1]